ncbi:hypothetical protein [Paraburkholderia fungorum]|uniref:hypothetical protein n=1 Tax=Paraburkholderia fungorum TaxID=134537 RepID=UPI001C1F085A|nr:hypothetical protein [Paraburkholderia fungorum]MBU7438416.1 hypothetical protein [Paraburkholderia fungorum]
MREQNDIPDQRRNSESGNEDNRENETQLGGSNATPSQETGQRGNGVNEGSENPASGFMKWVSARAAPPEV